MKKTLKILTLVFTIFATINFSPPVLAVSSSSFSGVSEIAEGESTKIRLNYSSNGDGDIFWDFMVTADNLDIISISNNSVRYEESEGGFIDITVTGKKAGTATLSIKDIETASVNTGKLYPISATKQIKVVKKKAETETTPQPSKPNESFTYIGDTKDYIVSTNSVRVRNYPVTGDILDMVNYGHKINGRMLSNNWVEFVHNGKKSYITSEFLITEESVMPKEPEATETPEVPAPEVTKPSEPAETKPAIPELPKDEEPQPEKGTGLSKPETEAVPDNTETTLSKEYINNVLLIDDLGNELVYTPAFEYDTKEYNILVSYDVKEINISVDFEKDNLLSVMHPDNVVLAENNTFSVQSVYDGIAQELFVFNITREDQLVKQFITKENLDLFITSDIKLDNMNLARLNVLSPKYDEELGFVKHGQVYFGLVKEDVLDDSLSYWVMLGSNKEDIERRVLPVLIDEKIYLLSTEKTTNEKLLGGLDQLKEVSHLLNKYPLEHKKIAQTAIYGYHDESSNEVIVPYYNKDGQQGWLGIRYLENKAEVLNIGDLKNKIEETQEELNNAMLIAGAIAGLLIILIVSTSIFLYKRKRKPKNKRSNKVDYKIDYHTSSESSVSEKTKHYDNITGSNPKQNKIRSRVDKNKKSY